MKIKTLSQEERNIQYNRNEIISAPLQLAGSLPLVEVLLNGQARMFLLDSGSPFSMLNSKYVEKEDNGETALSSYKDVSGTVSNSSRIIFTV